MRARLLVAGACALVALPLSACASQTTTSVRDEPARGVCDGVAQCRVVADEDVDGDGRGDQVGFVVESKKRVVVRVTTAAGRTLSRGLDTVWFPKGEFYGAAPVDGRPGAELVVGTNMGAHTLWFTTLTIRSGNLVRLAPPGGEDEWMVDGAYSFHAGVSRRTENGRAVVVLRDAARDGAAPRFSGRDRTYVWRDGGWQHESTVRTRYRSERAVSRIGGWHVEGLPRLPSL